MKRDALLGLLVSVACGLIYPLAGAGFTVVLVLVLWSGVILYTLTLRVLARRNRTDGLE